MTGSREVEVKYRVMDLAALERVLRGLGVDLGTPVLQDDQAYAPELWSFGDSKLGVSFARLRTQGRRHEFTVKRPLGNAQSCDEFESEVADREQMHRAVLAMGFRPTVRVVKHRREAAHGRYLLCLDEVEGIGPFFEVERMVPPGESTEAAQLELAEFVASLGAGLERTHETYDSLVRDAEMARA